MMGLREQGRELLAITTPDSVEKRQIVRGPIIRVGPLPRHKSAAGIA
jgi:hypothetical protein